MRPDIDVSAPLQLVVNAASGGPGASSRRDIVEAALRAAGRRADWRVCAAEDLAAVARRAAVQAAASGTAVVALGGDGTVSTVAGAAHAAGCPLGVVPQGTFNYFARTHGIPEDPAAAIRGLLEAAPVPVQVAGVNGRVFLVNASLGLYPELLEDREAFKARFGRSRWVAFLAGCATLLRARRPWRVHIETGGQGREVRTLTLFVGNNRLQLRQLGAEPEDTVDGTPGDGSMAAVMLRPLGLPALIGLMLHGAIGRLGEAAGVERFEFQRMVVRPRWGPGRRRVKVAFDGEVAMLRAPLDFHVLDTPLYLLAPGRAGAPG